MKYLVSIFLIFTLSFSLVEARWSRSGKSFRTSSSKSSFKSSSSLSTPAKPSVSPKKVTPTRSSSDYWPVRSAPSQSSGMWFWGGLFMWSLLFGSSDTSHSASSYPLDSSYPSDNSDTLNASSGSVSLSGVLLTENESSSNVASSIYDLFWSSFMYLLNFMPYIVLISISPFLLGLLSEIKQK